MSRRNAGGAASAAVTREEQNVTSASAKTARILHKFQDSEIRELRVQYCRTLLSGSGHGESLTRFTPGAIQQFMGGDGAEKVLNSEIDDTKKQLENWKNEPCDDFDSCVTALQSLSAKFNRASVADANYKATLIDKFLTELAQQEQTIRLKYTLSDADATELDRFEKVQRDRAEQAQEQLKQAQKQAQEQLEEELKLNENLKKNHDEKKQELEQVREIKDAEINKLRTEISKLLQGRAQDDRDIQHLNERNNELQREVTSRNGAIVNESERLQTNLATLRERLRKLDRILIPQIYTGVYTCADASTITSDDLVNLLAFMGEMAREGLEFRADEPRYILSFQNLIVPPSKHKIRPEPDQPAPLQVVPIIKEHPGRREGGGKEQERDGRLRTSLLTFSPASAAATAAAGAGNTTGDADTDGSDVDSDDGAATTTTTTTTVSTPPVSAAAGAAGADRQPATTTTHDRRHKKKRRRVRTHSTKPGDDNEGAETAAAVAGIFGSSTPTDESNSKRSKRAKHSLNT